MNQIYIHAKKNRVIMEALKIGIFKEIKSFNCLITRCF
jgi:hypothetical protein